GLQVQVQGEGSFVARQMPEANTYVQPGAQITLFAFDVQRRDGFIRMPSVVGLSLREAMNRLAIANLEPVVYGHGKVARQKPEPGARVRAGIRCILELEAPREFFAALPGGRLP
ncbi:MAG: PASTA domain-containing protein, partial [Calditrichaeota bacterium]